MIFIYHTFEHAFVTIKGTSKNRFEKQKRGVRRARKADEARLYALRGGLTQQTACSARFCSNKVFRGALK